MEIDIRKVNQMKMIMQLLNTSDAELDYIYDIIYNCQSILCLNQQEVNMLSPKEQRDLLYALEAFYINYRSDDLDKTKQKQITYPI